MDELGRCFQAMHQGMSQRSCEQLTMAKSCHGTSDLVTRPEVLNFPTRLLHSQQRNLWLVITLDLTRKKGDFKLYLPVNSYLIGIVQWYVQNRLKYSVRAAQQSGWNMQTIHFDCQITSWQAERYLFGQPLFKASQVNDINEQGKCRTARLRRQITPMWTAFC